MTKKKVVVALGHTALGKTMPEQRENVKKAAKAIADLVEEGAEVAITHSNSKKMDPMTMQTYEYYRAQRESAQ